ncbi:Hypothetical protein SMAX5B_000314 [Scophthalmus maximus]|uniref:Uncharacterized protein n=1 Tax=Scophthalmus maximus TaxID=52904 RepID=A0A2U9CK69_SCOMX|nr:Hypothetical protein SMAX5B_000314 [Scophthalmus maximus]
MNSQKVYSTEHRGLHVGHILPLQQSAATLGASLWEERRTLPHVCPHDLLLLTSLLAYARLAPTNFRIPKSSRSSEERTSVAPGLEVRSVHEPLAKSAEVDRRCLPLLLSFSRLPAPLGRAPRRAQGRDTMSWCSLFQSAVRVVLLRGGVVGRAAPEPDAFGAASLVGRQKLRKVKLLPHWRKTSAFELTGGSGSRDPPRHSPVG